MRHYYPQLQINDRDLVIFTLRLMGFSSVDTDSIGFPFHQTVMELRAWQRGAPIWSNKPIAHLLNEQR